LSHNWHNKTIPLQLPQPYRLTCTDPNNTS
jgi:hypothetical protein